MFRWTVSDDLAACASIQSAYPCSADEWEKVASTISLRQKISGRAMKERVQLLVKKFRADDNLNARRSGTEEEMSELQSLLQTICDLINDIKATKAAQKRAETDAAAKSQQHRLKALETLRNKNKTASTPDVDEDSDKPTDDTPVLSVKRPRKNKDGDNTDFLQYLTKKDENAMVLKREEMEINRKLKDRELALQERKMALEEAKAEQARVQLELLQQQLRQ